MKNRYERASGENSPTSSSYGRWTPSASGYEPLVPKGFNPTSCERFRATHGPNKATTGRAINKPVATARRGPPLVISSATAKTRKYRNVFGRTITATAPNPPHASTHRVRRSGCLYASTAASAPSTVSNISFCQPTQTLRIAPIMWIVITAIWVFNMTVESGHFAVLRRSVETVSKDQRIQAVMIAFCFGALLEALAGFGAPVAITSMMMVALGFGPIKAASLALVANTAPVPFGAIATPITTLSEVTGLEMADLGAMVGRQTPLLAIFLPLTLIAMVDGRRGIGQTWPVAVVAGFAFAVGQFACSNFGSVELTDIVASLMSMAAVIAFVRVWERKSQG